MSKRGTRPAKTRGYNPPGDAVTNAILSVPIKVMGVECNELHFRSARFGDLRGLVLTELDHLSGDDVIMLTQRLANLPLPSVEQIDISDLTAVMEAVGTVLAPFDDSEEETDETEET